jgi:hypothetical protein
MSWLLVERLVQVNDHDIGMLRNVKEMREDLDWLPIFHLRLWRLCLNLFLRCFNPCVRDINLRVYPLLVRSFRRDPTSIGRITGGVELLVPPLSRMEIAAKLGEYVRENLVVLFRRFLLFAWDVRCNRESHNNCEPRPKVEWPYVMNSSVAMHGPLISATWIWYHLHRHWHHGYYRARR